MTNNKGLEWYSVARISRVLRSQRSCEQQLKNTKPGWRSAPARGLPACLSPAAGRQRRIIHYPVIRGRRSASLAGTGGTFYVLHCGRPVILQYRENGREGAWIRRYKLRIITSTYLLFSLQYTVNSVSRFLKGPSFIFFSQNNQQWVKV